MGERVLVTGGAGFIGSHLCRYLWDLDHHVVNVDKLNYAVLPRTLHELSQLRASGRYELVVADVATEQDVLRNVLRQHKPTKIYHLAAESHVDRSIMWPHDFFTSNVIGTYQVLEVLREYCRGLRRSELDELRIVYVSTDEVYGSLNHGDASFDERSPLRPTSPYSATKACGDVLCHAWQHTYGLPVIVTHCTNNYGPGQFPEKLIPKAIQCLLDAEPIPVHGNGRQVRDWLYVVDHVRGLVSVAHHGTLGNVYNFSSGDEIENIDVVQMVIDQVAYRLNSLRDVPLDSLIEYVDARPTDDIRYSLLSDRVRALLGWRCYVNIGDGIRQTVNYYMEDKKEAGV